MTVFEKLICLFFPLDITFIFRRRDDRQYSDILKTMYCYWAVWWNDDFSIRYRFEIERERGEFAAEFQVNTHFSFYGDEQLFSFCSPMKRNDHVFVEIQITDTHDCAVRSVCSDAMSLMNEEDIFSFTEGLYKTS